MRLLLLSVPFLLAGCAGYAIDYVKPRTSIIGPELARYGLTAGQSQCMSERLGTSLSVWQLRQLQIAAASVTRGYSDPNRLGASDLLWVASTVKDKRVGVAAEGAAEACGLRATASAAAAEKLQPVASEPAARPVVATWVNLGSAPTGQSIAVDATSLAEQGSYRSGWFRLTNPGAARGSASYLLRVDCTARTINSMALRKLGPTGAVTEERDFGPNGEGAAAIEDGTVMQIAFLALCT